MVVAEARQVANDAFSRVLRLVDSVIAPETRQQFYNNISAFAGEHPLLAVRHPSSSFAHSKFLWFDI